MTNDQCRDLPRSPATSQSHGWAGPSWGVGCEIAGAGRVSCDTDRSRNLVAQVDHQPLPEIRSAGSCCEYMVQIVYKSDMLRCNPMRDAALLERY
eukprot:3656054-Prymnesium_polylepis.2